MVTQVYTVLLLIFSIFFSCSSVKRTPSTEDNQIAPNCITLLKSIVERPLQSRLVNEPSNRRTTYIEINGEIVPIGVTDRGWSQIGHFYQDIGLTLDWLSTKKVLDVGTGEGNFVKDLWEEGIDALGTDINTSRWKNEEYLVQDDILQSSLESNSFDVIFHSNSLISHISTTDHPDKEKIIKTVLAQFDRILKGGGTVFIVPVSEDFLDTMVHLWANLNIVTIKTKHKWRLHLKKFNQLYKYILKRNFRPQFRKSRISRTISWS